MESSPNNRLWIRAEDSEHPKLERLRRAVTVEVGPPDDVASPWVVWGSGLSRSWLIQKLDSGGQVLIMPPWISGAIAGLPPVREANPPGGELELQNQSFAVSASTAVDPSPAWQEHGRFTGSKLAWLVAHEPFAGSGRVWLSTAEILVTSPSTRPSEAKRILAAIVAYLTQFCRQKVRSEAAIDNADSATTGEVAFTVDDVPYLLAAFGLSGTSTTQVAAQFISRRLGVEPDLCHLEKILAHPNVKSEMAFAVGSRPAIARAIDNLGYRSFRMEIEETCHE